MFTAWLRVIRVRFLFASVMAVAIGLAVHWWQNNTIDAFLAALTLAGVLALHASVDLLNDYWDHRRGIDARTKRTGMSGGTGVLPEGLLQPGQVYRAGMLFLVLGAVIGGYFILTHGVIIAVLLGFAIISIYFYSTKIVDSGLAEIFVAIKGAMIVLGTFFIQGNYITADAAFAGVMAGVLSSMVLFVTSFPDHDADKLRGRRTLVIVAGKRRAARLFWAFPAAAYAILFLCIILGIFPVHTLVLLLAAPLLAVSGARLHTRYDQTDGMIPVMSGVIHFGRITGALLAAGFVLASLIIYT